MTREEAIEVVKKNWPNIRYTRLREVLETLIPELAESEDERTRKELIVELQSWEGIPESKRRQYLSYLEKNLEYMKPNKQEWSEEDKMNLNGCICSLHQYGYMTYADFLRHLPERFNLEQKQEWSEKDEKILDSLIHLYNREFGTNAWPWANGAITYGDVVKFLKSLRPSWKPSEDEERLINTSISFLKDFADKGYENAVECIDWLKSKLNGNSGK